MRGLALKGWLLIGLLHGGVALAEPHVQGVCIDPELLGMAVGCPTIERSSDRERYSGQSQAPQPIPTAAALNNQGEAPSAGSGEQDAKTREEERAEKDLAAQQSMADSTRTLIQLTVAQIALGVIGTAAVFLALRYTYQSTVAATQAAEAATEANERSRETFIADQRPWLSVTYKPYGPLIWDDNTCYLEIEFEMKNTGKTPALNAFVDTQQFFFLKVPNLLKRQYDFSDALRAEKDDGRGKAVFPGDIEQQRLIISVDARGYEAGIRSISREEMEKNPIIIRIVGCAQYRSPFEGSLYQTGFIFSLVYKTDDGFDITLSPSIGDIPKARLRLEPWFYSGRIF